MDNPFKITVYQRGFQFAGWITDPVQIKGTVRHNRLSNFQITLRDNDEMVVEMLDKTARVTIEYRGTYLSGKVMNPTGMILGGGTVTFNIESDWRALLNTQAWVRPGSNPRIQPTSLDPSIPEGAAQAYLPGGLGSGQPGTIAGQYGYHFWPDGSAQAGGEVVSASESAIKRLIRLNLINRLARPFTIATDQARGGNAREAGMLPLVRFGTIEDAITDLLRWSGLTLNIGQMPGADTIAVDVSVPRTYGQVLTPESGIISNGTWALSYPTATRVILGGPGEDAARAFWQVGASYNRQENGGIVSDGLDPEDEYDDVVEIFKDATGATLTWPDGLADQFRVAKYFLLRPEIDQALKNELVGYFQRAAAPAIQAGRAKSGVTIELSESDAFYYGSGGYRLGDRVTIQAANQTFSDRITEVEFSLTAGDGLTVKPVVGQKAGDESRILAEQIIQLATAQRRLSTGR